MRCDEARDRMLDRLSGEIEAEKLAELEAHIAACAACGEEAASLEQIWSDLDALRSQERPAGAGDVAEIIARHRRETARGRGSRWRGAGLALAAMLLLALGVGAGRWSARETQPRPPLAAGGPGTNDYLLLLSSSSRAGAALAPQRLADIVAEYSAWADELARRGQLVSAEKLAADPGYELVRVDGRVTRGREAVETLTERLGGFFVIRARDEAEALAIAADCPHLRYGGKVQLRAIDLTR